MQENRREFNHISAVFKALLWNNTGRTNHWPGLP